MLEHFGPEAPIKLNQYAIQIEDAMLQSLQHQEAQAQELARQAAYIADVQDVLDAAADERAALRRVLTEPEILSDYVEQFFGPNGPYPTQTPGEQARASMQEGLVQPTGPLLPHPRQDDVSMGRVAQAQPFQRPQVPPMPAPAANPQGNPSSFWSSFSRTMDVRPQMAYQLLDQASPDVLRSKVLFVEG